MNRAVSPEPTLSVVVPVYESARTLPELHRRLAAILSRLDEVSEMVFVDDASSDESWKVLRDLARSDARITAIRLARNVGQGDATLCGLSRGRGRTFVTIDDDLQQRPEEIPRLLAALSEPGSPCLACGVARERRQSRWRQLASRWSTEVSNLVLEKPLPPYFTTFCALDRTLAEAAVARGWRGTPLVALLVQLAERVERIDVQHEDSALGGGRYRLRDLVRLPLRRLALASRARVSRLTLSLLVLAGVTAGLAMVAWPALFPVAVVPGLAGAALALAFRNARRARATTSPALPVEELIRAGREEGRP